MDEEVDPLSYCAPAARLERKVVAFGDDDAGAGDDAPSRHRLVQVPSVDRDEDLRSAVSSHPIQGCQVALDVESVRGALAVAAPQVVQDGVGQVEAVHGDEPGEEAGSLSRPSRSAAIVDFPEPGAPVSPTRRRWGVSSAANRCMSWSTRLLTRVEVSPTRTVGLMELLSQSTI